MLPLAQNAQPGAGYFVATIADMAVRTSTVADGSQDVSRLDFLDDNDRGEGDVDRARGALVGRDRELQILRDFVSSPDQAGRSLLLRGGPGIGKTALLEVAAANATELGQRILRAAGAGDEAGIPYAALHQVLLPLHDQLDRLPCSEREALRWAICGDAEPPASPLAVGHATLRLLQHHADECELLVILDDVSWLDARTASVLGFVARRLDGGRVRLLAARGPGGPTMLDLPGITQVTIRPLSESAAEQLVDQRHPLLPANLRQRVLAEATGNPLALLELPAAFQQSSGTSEAAGPGDWVPLTERLRAVFGAGLNTVSEGARRLLLLGALDGSGDLRFLAAAGSLPHAARDLLQVERAGLARVDQGSNRFTFMHALTRSAVIAGANPAERRSAHHVLAKLYADQPERYSRHLASATIEPDETVAVVLEAAAKSALRRGDARAAMTMLLRAAELSPVPRGRGRRLTIAAHLTAEVTGELERASRLLLDAASTDNEPDQSLQLATSAALVLLSGDGDVDVANRLLLSALNHAEQAGDLGRQEHEEALHALLRVCHFGERPDLWDSFYRHLERLPDPPAALAISSRTLADPAHLASPALEELDTAIAALTTEQDPTRIVRLCIAGVYVDRAGDCRHALWRVVRDGRAGGAAGSAVTALALLAQDAFRAGDWAAADRLAAESEATAETCGGYWSIHARHTRAFIAAARGDLDAVEQITDELQRWALPRGIGVSPWAPRCLAAITRGDFERAYQEATKPGPAGVLPRYVPYAIGTILDLVEAAVRSGRQAEARAHVRAVEEAGLADMSSRLALLAQSTAAVTAPDHQCAELFESALSLPEAGRWPFEQARIQLLFGERLRRLRRVCDARAQLFAAVDTFRRLGAGPWVSRATAELNATGVVAARPGTAARVCPLTPQERKVVGLAAGGLTNKQIGERLFLSPRTVGFHLSRAFPKLGVGSRSALRDALLNLQSPPAADLARYGTLVRRGAFPQVRR